MTGTENKPYRVLARKYRPRNFDELVGQDALVRTLKNAIESGRLAHAYMLTGVRGVGKTTTARIIARALNYTGPDGKSGPTTGPTDDCAICQAIAEDRHPDVLEMDAASRTGVDDIREILDGVRYAPTSARYKVYIIDEVHMLSKQAFNALLKTLEEPPPRVIFIFATTEIRKVPVTVLSRCQRFDLRRVDAETLSAYYGKICGLENVKPEAEALQLIARAADGSVRDGLSLLDQAMALGGGTITAQQVRDMLGLADRQRVMDLLDAAIRGDTPRALDIMSDLYRSGADPAVLVQDMLDLTHTMTRLRALPSGAKQPDAPPQAAALASTLTMAILGRAWQILLKGLSEVSTAPNPQAAAEMLVIRLSYAAGLPDPADLMKKIKAAPADAVSPRGAPSEPRRPEPVALRAVSGGAAVAQAVPQEQPSAGPVAVRAIASLADAEALLRENREMALAGEVYQYVHLVNIEQGLLDVRIEPNARPGLAQDLSRVLSRVAGSRWVVSVSSATGAPTLAEQRAAAQNSLIDEAKKNPVVAEALRLFPGAEISVQEDR